MNKAGLMLKLNADQICERRAEIELLVTKAISFIGDADKIAREIGMNYGIESAFDRHTMYGIGGNDHNIVKRIMQKVDVKAWYSVIETGGFKELMSVKEKRKMDGYIETAPPLTIKTLRATFASLMNDRPDMLQDLIKTAFTERDKGYKSNAGMKINKRQVIDSVFSGDFYRNWYGYRVERLQDIVRAISLITGNKNIEIIPLLADVGKNGGSYFEHGCMKFRVFKNGNVHVYIEDKKVLNMLNDILSGCFSGQLGDVK